MPYFLLLCGVCRIHCLRFSRLSPACNFVLPRIIIPASFAVDSARFSMLGEEAYLMPIILPRHHDDTNLLLQSMRSHGNLDPFPISTANLTFAHAYGYAESAHLWLFIINRLLHETRTWLKNIDVNFWHSL